MPYPELPPDFPEEHRSVWVDIDPSLYDPEVGNRTYNEYLDELEFAAGCGFDAVGVNEHHSNGYGLMPSPNIIEAQERRFVYGETARTPCVADFEDFLKLAYTFNPLYDGDFLPVWDLDSDGTISFSDFVLFTPDFGKRIRMLVPSGIRNLGGTGESNAISVSLRVVDLVTGQHTLHELKTRSAQGLADITVEGLISNGSTLGVDSWAFALARSYRTPSGSLTLSTELTPEWATLALRLFSRWM